MRFSVAVSGAGLRSATGSAIAIDSLLSAIRRRGLPEPLRYYGVSGGGWCLASWQCGLFRELIGRNRRDDLLHACCHIVAFSTCPKHPHLREKLAVSEAIVALLPEIQATIPTLPVARQVVLLAVYDAIAHVFGHIACYAIVDMSISEWGALVWGLLGPRGDSPSVRDDPHSRNMLVHCVIQGEPTNDWLRIDITNPLSPTFTRLRLAPDLPPAKVDEPHLDRTVSVQQLVGLVGSAFCFDTRAVGTHLSTELAAVAVRDLLPAAVENLIRHVTMGLEDTAIDRVAAVINALFEGTTPLLRRRLGNILPYTNGRGLVVADAGCSVNIAFCSLNFDDDSDVVFVVDNGTASVRGKELEAARQQGHIESYTRTDASSKGVLPHEGWEVYRVTLSSGAAKLVVYLMGTTRHQQMQELHEGEMQGALREFSSQIDAQWEDALDVVLGVAGQVQVA